MNDIWPPLPVALMVEIKLSNEYMIQNPNPNKAAWDKLLKLYLTNFDGITISPKLPPMCKTYHDQWKQNNMIKLAHRE